MGHIVWNRLALSGPAHHEERLEVVILTNRLDQCRHVFIGQVKCEVWELAKARLKARLAFSVRHIKDLLHSVV